MPQKFGLMLCNCSLASNSAAWFGPKDDCLSVLADCRADAPVPSALSLLLQSGGPERGGKRAIDGRLEAGICGGRTIGRIAPASYRRRAAGARRSGGAGFCC